MAHEYTARVVWEGNRGEGTGIYTGYGRGYRAEITGKPVIAGSADPAFRGDPERHNPEELFLIALSACHMLFYLSLCARRGVRVLAYEDDPSGALELHPGGGGRFREIRLSPVVVIADGDDASLARDLHRAAHELCFIANSCSVPVRCEPSVVGREEAGEA